MSTLPQVSAKNPSTLGLQVIHVLIRASISPTIYSTSVRTLFTPTCRIPLFAQQLQQVELAQDNSPALAGTAYYLGYA